jgi:hypothetical protein
MTITVEDDCSDKYPFVLQFIKEGHHRIFEFNNKVTSVAFSLISQYTHNYKKKIENFVSIHSVHSCLMYKYAIRYFSFDYYTYQNFLENQRPYKN